MKLSLRQRESCSKIDYGKPEWTGYGMGAEIVRAVGIVLLFAWFFYRSVWAAILLSPVGVLYMRKRRQEKLRKRKRELAVQFRECILSVSASLRAGYSVENAFSDSLGVMKLLYGSKADISRELVVIKKGLIINIPLEELLWDLGKRSSVGVILDFAEVFSIAKRSGGNVSEVIRSSSEMIDQRVRAEEEIHTMTSSRRLEQNVMNVMPFGILFYIECSSPGYFSPMYHNLTGIAVMSICLVVYLAAYYLSGLILSGTDSGW